MGRELSLFIGTFTTLLAIINPFEVLPVYLKLLEGKDVNTHRQVAWKACVYALLLSLFFLIFGTLILRLFGVPLAMVRIVGGIILMKIGFELFSPSKSDGGIIPAGGGKQDANIAFVPLAMPLMCGPGAIATILGMTSTIRQSSTELASFVAIVAAILATMLVTYLCLAYAGKLSEKLGALGIDAVTRIVEQFAVDARRAPKRIFHAHPPDQCTEVGLDLRPPRLRLEYPLCADCVAKVESCGATNLSQNPETGSTRSDCLLCASR